MNLNDWTMGWGRTLLLGAIGNRMDIADSEEEIRRIKNGRPRLHAITP